MEQTQREVSRARAVVFKIYSSLLFILFKKNIFLNNQGNQKF